LPWVMKVMAAQARLFGIFVLPSGPLELDYLPYLHKSQVVTAASLGRMMRGVVTSGTGRKGAAAVPVAGKTGTAELADAASHAWFIGFAPYGGAGRKIAFSVLVENGVYGGATAAPAAAEIVNAALKLGLIQP